MMNSKITAAAGYQHRCDGLFGEVFGWSQLGREQAGQAVRLEGSEEGENRLQPEFGRVNSQVLFFDQ